MRVAGNTPLHYAAAADSPGACQLLVQFGAEVNAVNAMGLTAKDLATAVRKTAALEYLKSVVVLDADGRTQAGLDQSLIMAISEEGPSSDGLRVYTLLQQGAGPNATDAATGLRALHLAAIRDAREAARFLLMAGAGSSMLTVDGPRLSPLACAVTATPAQHAQRAPPRARARG
jgi:ankyrin repeat protein